MLCGNNSVALEAIRNPNPRHTLKGLLKHNCCALFRMCTKTDDFWEAVKILFQALKNRGYSKSLLRQCLTSFKSQKLVHQKRRVLLITQYSSFSEFLNYRLKRNFDRILGPSGPLDNHEVISAYRNK